MGGGLRRRGPARERSRAGGTAGAHRRGPGRRRKGRGAHSPRSRPTGRSGGLVGGRLDRPRLGRLPLHGPHRALGGAGRRAFAGGPERALVAQVAANEVAGRLGAALFLGPHNGQFWASIHCAGRGRRLGRARPRRRRHRARAGDCALPAALRDVARLHGPESKLLTAAEPAAVGARAALLAAEGVTGALDVIEHPRGVLASLSFAPRPAMFGGLGDVWLTDTLAFKRLPGCAYLQSVGEAACLQASRPTRCKHRDRGRLAHLRDGGARPGPRPDADPGQLLGDPDHGGRAARRAVYTGRARSRLAGRAREPGIRALAGR